MPSTLKPTSVWKFFTASSVWGPKSPSTGPGHSACVRDGLAGWGGRSSFSIPMSRHVLSPGFKRDPLQYALERTGWLGREDSNLRISESESANTRADSDHIEA